MEIRKKNKLLLVCLDWFGLVTWIRFGVSSKSWRYLGMKALVLSGLRNSGSKAISPDFMSSMVTWRAPSESIEICIAPLVWTSWLLKRSGQLEPKCHYSENLPLLALKICQLFYRRNFTWVSWRLPPYISIQRPFPQEGPSLFSRCRNWIWTRDVKNAIRICENSVNTDILFAFTAVNCVLKSFHKIIDTSVANKSGLR